MACGISPARDKAHIIIGPSAGTAWTLKRAEPQGIFPSLRSCLPSGIRRLPWWLKNLERCIFIRHKHQGFIKEEGRIYTRVSLETLNLVNSSCRLSHGYVYQSKINNIKSTDRSHTVLTLAFGSCMLSIGYEFSSHENTVFPNYPICRVCMLYLGLSLQGTEWKYEEKG